MHDLLFQISNKVQTILISKLLSVHGVDEENEKLSFWIEEYGQRENNLSKPYLTREERRKKLLVLTLQGPQSTA